MQTIKEDYHENLTLADAEKLVMKTLKQVMEDAISVENVELCVIPVDTGKLVYRDDAHIGGLLNGLN